MFPAPFIHLRGTDVTIEGMSTDTGSIRTESMLSFWKT